MFYPERIVSIRTTDHVLEIGPGASPHPRANVFLERRFSDEGTAYAQRGYADAKADDARTVYYDGGAFPFEDTAFDYVICSHVIEHVPVAELDGFISELQRVAPRGYIEFPTIFYELINFQDVHLWLMNYRENEILFFDKQHFSTNYIHQLYRQLFYGEKQLLSLFNKYKELFFVGFEWQQDVHYRLVDALDELIDADDMARLSEYLNNGRAVVENNRPVSSSKPSLLRQVARQGKKIVLSVFKRSEHPANMIHPTAQLEPRALIDIGPHSEIKDYVIIRTHENRVSIGDYTQINPFTVIYGGKGVLIGDNVMIGPHCMLAAGQHNYAQVEKPMRFAGSISRGPIIIEDNAWIGANVTILDGVTIGKDAVVGANSVVTDSVKPYDIVAGVPAKVIGNRLEIIGNNHG